MAEDRWTYWQRENAGQTDHGVTTMRVFLIAVVVVVLAVVRLGPTVSADESPTSTTRSPCAELQVLRAAGVTHGPDFWAAKGGCRSSYKSSP